MALKPDLVENVSTILYVCNVAAEAGQCAFLLSPQGSGHGSGQGINDNAPQVVPTGTGGPASGTDFIGIFLTDVVNVDLTTYYLQRPKGTVQVIGDNVCLLKDGEYWTNRVNGTPTIGAPAYPGVNSNMGTSGIGGNAAVGKFLTVKNASGYCKVSVKVA